MAKVQETIRLKGIRCERCVARLGKVLEGHEGLESASASLRGDLTVTYDDKLTSREALLKEMLRGGFREQVEEPAQTPS